MGLFLWLSAFSRVFSRLVALLKETTHSVSQAIVQTTLWQSIQRKPGNTR